MSYDPNNPNDPNHPANAHRGPTDYVPPPPPPRDHIDPARDPLRPADRFEPGSNFRDARVEREGGGLTWLVIVLLVIAVIAALYFLWMPADPVTTAPVSDPAPVTQTAPVTDTAPALDATPAPVPADPAPAPAN